MLWSEKRGGRTGRYVSDARLSARGCGLKADTEPCGTRFSSRCCSRESEMLSSRNGSSVFLQKHGAWRHDVRKTKHCVRKIEDLGRRSEFAPFAGHHVRAKIARGAEASSRSEGLAYARSERSVEP